jgi:hypothetical protein
MARQFSTSGAKEEKGRPIISMMRFIITFGRYAGAIFVAFVASMAILSLLFAMTAGLEFWELPGWVTSCVLGVAMIVVGFCGVFTGSLCFDGPNRREGSVVLLILGLLFCIWFQCWVMDGEAHPVSWLSWLGTAGLGGLGAVMLVFRRCPRKS